MEALPRGPGVGRSEDGGADVAGRDPLRGRSSTPGLQDVARSAGAHVAQGAAGGEVGHAVGGRGGEVRAGAAVRRADGVGFPVGVDHVAHECGGVQIAVHRGQPVVQHADLPVDVHVGGDRDLIVEALPGGPGVGGVEQGRGIGWRPGGWRAGALGLQEVARGSGPYRGHDPAGGEIRHAVGVHAVQVGPGAAVGWGHKAAQLRGV